MNEGELIVVILTVFKSPASPPLFSFGSISDYTFDITL